MKLKNIKAVVFDLDNTLYPYSSYYRLFFLEASKLLSEKYTLSKSELFQKGETLCKEKGSAYPKLFNDWLKNFNLEGDLPLILDTFQNLKPEILEPYSNTKDVLENLKNTGYKLAILSDGPKKRQLRKLVSLVISKYFD